MAANVFRMIVSGTLEDLCRAKQALMNDGRVDGVVTTPFLPNSWALIVKAGMSFSDFNNLQAVLGLSSLDQTQDPNAERFNNLFAEILEGIN